MNYLRFHITFLLVLLSQFVVGQILQPIGKFLDDSIKLGYPIEYSLSITHSSETPILFPDSSYNYFPFEFISKEYFPTKTTKGKSIDSAVYTLRSFDLSTTQSLGLPIFVTNNEDSSAIKSPKDSVYLKEYLPESPINETFKEEAGFDLLQKEINYPWILVYTLLSLLIVFIIYFYFGKTIRRRVRLITIRIDHNKFIKNFHRLQNEFSATKKTSTLERSLSAWKVYLAKIENKPINTYTTTEISSLYNQEELKNGLNIIDRAIYGGLISDESEKAIATLRRFSIRQYHRRKKEIQDV